MFNNVLNNTIQKAQGVCDFFPCDSAGDQNQTTSSQGVNSRIEELFNLGVSLIFAGLVILGIFIIVSAAFKIVNSEGNEEDLQSSATAIKNVFIGVGLIIGGLIGIVVINAILGNNIFDFDIDNPAGVDDIPIIN